MSGKTKVVAIAAGVLAIAVVAYATGTIDDFLAGFDEGGTITIVHTYAVDGDDGPLTTLDVHRSGDQPGNTRLVNFVLVIEAEDVLTLAVLETAEDTNEDGLISANEWTVVGTATIAEENGVTTAVCASTSLSNELDAYRIRYERTDIDTTCENWKNNPDVDIDYFESE